MVRIFSVLIVMVSFLMVMGCKISGKITVEDGSDIGIHGVLVELSGDASKTVTTDREGNYSFKFLTPGTYEITPTKCDISHASQEVIKTELFTDIEDVNITFDEIVWTGSFNMLNGDELADLNGISVVTGSLTIDGIEESQISGLECLSKVVESLNIAFCDNLINLNGLNNITSVGGLFFDSNTSLEDLSALNNLTGKLGWLTVGRCPNLTTFNGLQGITSIGSSTLIAENGLESLEGLHNLASFGQIVYIVENNSLTDIEALSNVTSLGSLAVEEGMGSIYICGNTVLPNLNGLRNLVSIKDDLFIIGNTALTSLGLSSLSSVGNDFRIGDNTNLPTTLAVALSDLVTIGGEATICGNLDGDDPCEPY